MQKLQLIDGGLKMIKVGIIGGSGLYNLELTNSLEKSVSTKYGEPSSPLRIGKLNGIEVVFLTRHGLQHTIPPTKVNFRANIQALKEAGCTHLIATTACGSLRREIERGHLVIVDQFIDFTRHRNITFYEQFEPGTHGHTAMAQPFDANLRKILISTCQELDILYHERGTVVTIEGPRFSTKSESKMFAAWGADVINMSIAPEAALANEAGIPYAAVAMSTDYDCLFDDVAPVTHEEVLKVFSENVSKVIKVITNALPKINSLRSKMEEAKAITFKDPFDLKKFIRTVPHWPKKGVMFRDITTLLQNPGAFKQCILLFKKRFENKDITKIAGIESRGFIFASALAAELHLPLALIRKKGKLPAKTIAVEYQLEYGSDKIEIHEDSIASSDSVLIVDDLIATGGTALAAAQLIEKAGGTVAGFAFVIYLPNLKGREKLKKYEVFSLIEFEGE